jgi:hypothetical protein
LVGFGCEAVMEPLSITAAVAAAVGIVSPTLHCVHRLAQDIQEIRDAPDTVESLQDDLLTLEEALKSLISPPVGVAGHICCCPVRAGNDLVQEVF